ncbi:anti-sigma factor [Variovorax terrae]|uniref:Anti-sigma factor n=1 Tax=Variovorax terrae TaxID=2923278 RepID=A0A9X1VUT0_9BURK|nr:anti-sigma factor [Variovorax terrae]MCJ0762242.1 anti-sigma factor [Variovorax terrae]
MNLHGNPALLDQLAASHALGTLRGGARRRFETLARQSATVRASALIWQERFASMTELQAAQMPSPNVWKRIENTLAAQRQRPAGAAVVEVAMFDKLRRALGWWRGAAMAAALAGVAAVLVGVNLNREVGSQAGQLAQAAQQNAQLVAQLQATPDIQYVAVLADEHAAASVLVTFDPRKQTLVLKRVGGYQEASDKSLQLWALPPGSGPKSLGVLGSGPVIRLTAAEGAVKEAPALAISLEPKGGVPSEGGPTGPVLFKGALLQTAL